MAKTHKSQAGLRNIVDSTSDDWHVDERDTNGGDILIKDANGVVIASIMEPYDAEDLPETLATARLMAASPKLRKVLEELLAGIDARERRTGIPQMGSVVDSARTLMLELRGR
jgi:hypothetical protein